jgi:hypothetical protein
MLERKSDFERFAFSAATLAICSSRLFCLLLGPDPLSRGVVGADQQKADDGPLRVAQRRDGDDRRKPAPALADLGQHVDLLDPPRGLEHQGPRVRT